MCPPLNGGIRTIDAVALMGGCPTWFVKVIIPVIKTVESMGWLASQVVMAR